VPHDVAFESCNCARLLVSASDAGQCCYQDTTRAWREPFQAASTAHLLFVCTCTLRGDDASMLHSNAPVSDGVQPVAVGSQCCRSETLIGTSDWCMSPWLLKEPHQEIFSDKLRCTAPFASVVDTNKAAAFMRLCGSYSVTCQKPALWPFWVYRETFTLSLQLLWAASFKPSLNSTTATQPQPIFLMHSNQ
jgi:hypothetical protein